MAAVAFTGIQLSALGRRPAHSVAAQLGCSSSRSAYVSGNRLVHTAIPGPAPQRRRGPQPVQASFFGVGAPEAVLVGVVALLVFGPKGLAQAAKSVGQTLRAFQPTIRELTQVSAELKSTLDREIGLDEIRGEMARPAVPTPRPAAAAEPSTAGAESGGGEEPAAGALSGLAADMRSGLGAVVDDFAATADPDIASKRAASAAAAWGGATAAAAPAVPLAAQQQDGGGAPLEVMSTEQLEAELARRRAGSGASDA